MKKEIGVVKSIYRYPVKSMAGESLASVSLGWHGIEGDRRFAFRRIDDASDFPWLNAGKLREMILYQPFNADGENGSSVPTHVRTPDGKELELRSEELRKELSAAHKQEVELMQLKHGMFDEAPLSLISTSTIKTIEQDANFELDVRRFRPNIFVETGDAVSFPEDEWLGKIIAFGEEDDAPAMSTVMRDVRCSMINLNPENGESTPGILKAVVRINQICAGIYGTTFRIGSISVGQKIYLVDV